MRLLVPTESRRAIKARKARRRRLTIAGALLPLVMVVAALYVWPQRVPPMGELYQDTDARVLTSLRAYRVDHDLERVDVGGRIWSYLRLGDHPEAVLFLHGLGGSHDIWWQQMRALSERYTVIAIDYPSEGTLRGAAFGVQGVLDREGVERVHLVGTSMGGYLAQYVAATEPERLASLVMSNTFPPGDWIDREYGTLARLLPILPPWVPQRFYRTAIEESIVPASGGSRLVRGYLLEQSYGLTKSDFRARLGVLRTPFSVPDLDDLGIPAMILEASNDPSVPADVRAQLVATYPDVPVVDLGEVGHFPYLNRPAAYTRALEDFWAALPGGSEQVGPNGGEGVLPADASDGTPIQQPPQ